MVYLVCLVDLVYLVSQSGETRRAFLQRMFALGSRLTVTTPRPSASGGAGKLLEHNTENLAIFRNDGGQCSLALESTGPTRARRCG